jgi:hypothetical protein
VANWIASGGRVARPDIEENNCGITSFDRAVRWKTPLRLGLGLVVLLSVMSAHLVHARDPDGRYANSPLKQWVDVPDEAVITEPNRIGRTMVWPIRGYLGLTIRCFMPGSMT